MCCLHAIGVIGPTGSFNSGVLSQEQEKIVGRSQPARAAAAAALRVLQKIGSFLARSSPLKQRFLVAAVNNLD